MPAAERGRLPRWAALSSVGGCAAIVTVLGGTAALLGPPQGKVQALRAVSTGLFPPVLVFWLCTALAQAGMSGRRLVRPAVLSSQTQMQRNEESRHAGHFQLQLMVMF